MCNLRNIHGSLDMQERSHISAKKVSESPQNLHAVIIQQHQHEMTKMVLPTFS